MMTILGWTLLAVALTALPLLAQAWQARRRDQRDFTQYTDPDRNRHWWTRECFYWVAEEPTPRVWRLGRLRWVRWQPRWFWSLSWRIHDEPVPAGKFLAWQLYVGWGKCDPTQTQRLRDGLFGEPRTGYLLTCTVAEMLAFRKRELDESPVWTNMGGA